MNENVNNSYKKDKEIGEKLLRLRKEKMETQEEVIKNSKAVATRISLSNYEKGKVIPPANILAKLAKYYNVSLDYLCGLSDNQYSDNLKIGDLLGLSDMAITKLKTYNHEKDINKKLRSIFAINSMLENLDFLKIGNYLTLPSEENIHLSKEEKFEIFELRDNPIYLLEPLLINENNQGKCDYFANKNIIRSFAKIKESKSCVDVHTKLVNIVVEEFNTKWELEGERLENTTFQEDAKISNEALDQHAKKELEKREKEKEDYFNKIDNLTKKE